MAGNNGQPSNRHACAACKHQRRKCDSDCIMYPFFPANKAEEFQATHKTFGIGNMTKMLKDLVSDEDRGKAVESFVWEGLAWKQDPIHGPLGLYRKLEKEIELLKNQLNYQQQIFPCVNELGLIGFDQSNINKVNEVTIASNAYTKENIGLDSQVNSYTKLLRGEEAKNNAVDCTATPYYASAQGQRGSVSQTRGIVIGQPNILQPPMTQGQQRVSHGSAQENNNNNVFNPGGTTALNGTGQAMAGQQRIMSQGRDGNAASYSNLVPLPRRGVQTGYMPYHGINDLTFQQPTMNTNQNYTTQDQLDQVTYEDNDGFNLGQK